MGNRQPEHKNPAPLQKLCLQYTKSGSARFASHRDFIRLFERALRRANVPMAFSSGFHPHQRISYLNAAATGAASKAEYLEISLAQIVDEQKLVTALNNVLPSGFTVLRAAQAPEAKLAPRFSYSLWQILFPENVDQVLLQDCVKSFLEAQQLFVSRETKKGVKRLDARLAVKEMTSEQLRLTFLLEHGSPMVRPEDILNALNEFHYLADPLQVIFERIKQGYLVEDQLVDPLDPANEPG